MIILEKEGSINLSKDFGAAIEEVHFLLKWDTEDDLDIHALVLQGGKLQDDSDFLYHRNLNHTTGCVKHSGDVRNGLNVMGTDDEIISLDLAGLRRAMPTRDEVLLTAEIYEAIKKGIDFSDITGATCTIVNAKTNEPFVQYRMDNDLIGETCAEIGKFYINESGDWEFKALGQGKNSLVNILRDAGANL